MDKTLADMTAEERAECVGMWRSMSDLPKVEKYWVVEIRASELPRWHHYYSDATEHAVRKFMESNEHIKALPEDCKRIVKATYSREEVKP